MHVKTLVAAGLLAASCTRPAAAAPSGELRCSVGGGIGFTVVGKRATSCIYYRRDGWVEFYIGSLGRLGLDLGPADARQVAFSVVVQPPETIGALEGDFVGLGAGATIGQGLAAESLVGGRGQSVQIVPISQTKFTGLNVNAGIADLHLRYAGTERRR